MNEQDNRNDDRNEATPPALSDLEAPNAEEVRGATATGRRQYRPMLIRKDVDKSSPMLDEN